VFIGLYWQRYGWVAPGMVVSGLEEELELSSGLPRLLYMKGPAPDREPQLAALLARVREEASVSYHPFQTPAELGRLVRDDLAALLSERFAASNRAAAAPAPPSRAAARGLRPLPVSMTSLVGREQAIDEVVGLTGQPQVRLVTLTGPGGVGKTRLAMAVGERLGDGTWLLILDNLEQVVRVAADLSELLVSSPGVTMLATSRTALGLAAEREYPVPPLPPPAEPGAVPLEELKSSPAVALFLDRARAVRPGFALTQDNAPAVVEICRRLEGLPLAIELAAARIRLLDPATLLTRLTASLDALGTGAVDRPERQRTLRATVEWSVGLLEDAERSLLETVAVFVDGWTVEAAGQVAGLDDDRALELSEALARHSLIYLDSTGSGPRSRMLETIRVFVAERLAARPDIAVVQRRHADYYRVLAGQADRPLRGTGQNQWLEGLEAEAGNLAAAVRWYLNHDRAPLPHLFRVLWLFWELRDHLGEAREWVGQLTPAAASLDHQARAELLWAAVATANEVYDDTAALAASRRLAPLLDGIEDPYLQAICQLVIGWASPITGDFEGALRQMLGSLAALRAQDEPYWTAVAAVSAAYLEITAGHLDDALRHGQEGRDLAERLGYNWLAAWSRVQLGTLNVVQGSTRPGICWTKRWTSAWRSTCPWA
jgi:predicted ATPase